MEENNLLFIDFETGGLTHYTHGVCSVAIQLADSKIQELYFKPQNKIYQQGALNVNGLNLEQLFKSGVSRQNLINMIDDFAKDKDYIIISGWNVDFDIGFLSQLYKDKKQNLPCPILSFDLMEIAKNNIPKIDKRKKEQLGVENYKLMTVYKYIFDDLEESKLHNAKYDLQLTIKLYNFFKNKGFFNQ